MRPLTRLLPALRPRGYSSAPPLIKTRTLPAPHTGTIKILTLNRPSAKNAISRALLSELSAHINDIQSGADTQTRVLILGSEVDGVFCAGADLKERATFTPTDTITFLTTLRRTLHTLSTLRIPTISAISSLALGGGLELALATSLRIVAPGAQMALPETRLAIIPGAGGTYRLTRLIGESRAMDMVLTARRVGGQEAVEVGLANWIVGAGAGAEGEGREEVIAAAVEIAGEICKGGPVAVGAALRAVREGTEEAEGREYGVVVGTRDRDEALRAFREKRGPVFKGE